MPKSCCVPGCTANKVKQPSLKFYIIPVEAGRRKQWLQAIRRAKVDETGNIKLGQVWSPKSNHAYVCSQHFISGEKSNAPNHPDYIPSFFPDRHDSLEKMSERLKRDSERQKRRENRSYECKAKKKLKLSNEGTTEESHQNLPVITQVCESSTLPEPPLEQSERQMLFDEIKNLRQERDDALKEISKLRKQLESCGMYSSSVENNNEKSEMMTGLTWPVFMQFYLYLVSCMGEHSVRKHQPAVALRDQFFQTLVKLRHGPTFDFIAHVSGVHRTTSIDHFWKWIDLMHSKLGFMVKWPERDFIHRIIPPVFKDKFPRLTSIIDCFEIFIDAPKNLLARAQTYSNYKKHTTVKVFISCNPYGQINFLSSAWGGRVSDVQVVRDSGFIDPVFHLPGDQILADRGFTLQEDFATKCSAELIIPAFTKGKKQMSAREIETSRDISNVRIHIERVIGLLKNRFHILQGPLSIRCVQRLKDEAIGTSLSNIDKILVVCAALTNSEQSIVYNDD